MGTLYFTLFTVTWHCYISIVPNEIRKLILNSAACRVPEYLVTVLGKDYLCFPFVTFQLFRKFHCKLFVITAKSESLGNKISLVFAPD